jgi:hypothetical protein
VEFLAKLQKVNAIVQVIDRKKRAILKADTYH